VSTLPPELAICVSFRAALASGVNAARRRGRVYIGPLSDNAREGGGDPQVASAARIALAQDADDLLTASNASADWSWGVYSRTDGILRPVVAGWVDDAFDVQRRRGLEPTTRSTYP
jgi:hypothetical protein